MRSVSSTAEDERESQLRGVAVFSQGHLELGLQHGQRHPQLVAGVGEERPLALEAVLETVEHLVQGGAQPVDLIDALR